MPNKNPFPWVPREWVNALFPWLRWSLMWFYTFTYRLQGFLPSLRDKSKALGQGQLLACGSCASVNIGRSIPKKKVPQALVTPLGLLGDSQSAPYIAIWGGHAGFNKAVMLWSSEVIAEVNADVQKSGPANFFFGASGEQLTLSGVNWSLMKTGVRVSVGATVLLEVTYLKGPCKNLDRYFSCPADKVRINPQKFPDSARVLAKVLVPGVVTAGDAVRIFQHPDGPQALQIQM